MGVVGQRPRGVGSSRGPAPFVRSRRVAADLVIGGRPQKAAVVQTCVRSGHCALSPVRIDAERNDN